MQLLGNFLTILGIIVTLISYFAQESVTLADLEPGVVKRWRASRAWVQRKLGHNTGTVVQVGTARAFAHGNAVVAWSWSAIQPEDDLSVRVEKLTHNVDQLHKNFGELREMDNAHFRTVTEALTARLGDIRRLVNEHHEEGRRETTTAMRYEVRGLLITLIGAGLSILG